jgi:hypothetical protein
VAANTPPKKIMNSQPPPCVERCVALLNMLESQIQQRIDELLAGSEPDPANLREVACLLKALPIFPDMSGCIALRPDGSMVFLDDESGKISEDIEPHWRLIALVNGSMKYPELKTLLPSRPENAEICQQCQGTGRFILENQVFESAFCGICSGLGWLS